MSKICNSQEIQGITKSADGVFVLFYADWCPFSQAFLPVYEKHASGRDGEFYRVLLGGNEALFDAHVMFLLARGLSLRIAAASEEREAQRAFVTGMSVVRGNIPANGT